MLAAASSPNGRVTGNPELENSMARGGAAMNLPNEAEEGSGREATARTSPARQGRVAWTTLKVLQRSSDNSPRRFSTPVARAKKRNRVPEVRLKPGVTGREATRRFRPARRAG
jgi:hypothetical protein